MLANLLTLDDLCSRVALSLSVNYEGAPNERIRGVPDQRTVRYYTTLGLVDRPVAMSGRTALYGRRHLLQLVAIKRLQGHGLSLHEIQQRLVGLTDLQLEEIARLPELPENPAAKPPPEDTSRRRDFWKSAPAPADEPAEPQDSPGPSIPALLQGVPLNDRAVLLLPLRRAPDAADLEAIQTVAAPLLRLLEMRRLID